MVEHQHQGAFTGVSSCPVHSPITICCIYLLSPSSTSSNDGPWFLSSCQRLVTIMIPLSTFSVCTAPHHTPPSNHLHSPSPPPPSGVCTQCGTHPSPICRCYPCTCHNICHQDISASSDIKDDISHNHMVINPRCLSLSMFH